MVVSIRKYDLRYSQELQHQFIGSPASDGFSDQEFAAVRHINIPALSEDELRQIALQSLELWEVVEKADVTFRDLLANPFNLRLVAALVASGIPSSELTPIRTQLQLLDRYWLE